MNCDEVTAVEMARSKKVSPKKFRGALRKESFEWHAKYDRWTVCRGSTEHSDMERVLNRL